MDTNVLLEDSRAKYALLDAVRCTGLGRLLRGPGDPLDRAGGPWPPIAVILANWSPRSILAVGLGENNRTCAPERTRSAALFGVASCRQRDPASCGRTLILGALSGLWRRVRLAVGRLLAVLPGCHGAFQVSHGAGGGGFDANLRLDGWSGGHGLRFWGLGGWRRWLDGGLDGFLRNKANFL